MYEAPGMVTFSGDGKAILVSPFDRNRPLELVDLENDMTSWTLKVQGRSRSVLPLSPNRAVSVSEDRRTVVLYERNEQPRPLFSVHYPISRIASDPEGRHLAVAQIGIEEAPEAPPGTFGVRYFSEAGPLGAWKPSLVSLVELEAPSERSDWWAPGGIRKLSVAPGGEVVAALVGAISSTPRILVFSERDAEAAAELSFGHWSIRGLEFWFEDHSQIAVTYLRESNRIVRTISIDPASLVDAVCKALGGDLGEDVWRLHVGNLSPYQPTCGQKQWWD